MLGDAPTAHEVFIERSNNRWSTGKCALFLGPRLGKGKCTAAARRISKFPQLSRQLTVHRHAATEWQPARKAFQRRNELLIPYVFQCSCLSIWLKYCISPTRVNQTLRLAAALRNR